MLIPLANCLVTVLEDAAARARLNTSCIRLEEMLQALCAYASLGTRLSSALSDPLFWKPAHVASIMAETGVWSEDCCVMFDQQTQRLFFDGSQAVLLGPYEPRHLAQAIGAAGELHPESFTRFGFDARGWRRALQVRIADH
jgi:hypothetical protein